MKRINFRDGISQNQLKMIALLSMTVDHIGVILFPKILLLRIIGRLAFPIFAFSLYEGAKYTRHPLRYLLRMLGLGLLCTLVYYLYDGRLYGNVLITFSLSLCMLLSLRWWREHPGRRWTGALLMAGSLSVTVVVCRLIYVDYGFVGCVLPLFAAVCDLPPVEPPAKRQWHGYPLVGFAVGLVMLSAQQGGPQYYCLLALPLLWLSGHRRGKARMKYFFYLYYPLHLLVLEGISLLLKHR